MQVILLEDVKSLGKKGTVVKVSDGYARNFLFPKKLATEANDGNMRALQHDTKVASDKRTRELEHARRAAEQLKAHPVRVPVKAGEKGKLYGAVTSQDIADALARATDWPIDKRKIELKEPIKKLGTYKVRLRMHHDVVPELTIEVVDQAHPPVDAAASASTDSTAP